MNRGPADRVAARATGAGIGLIALMLTWLIGNRLTGLIWDPPVGPTVAIVGATVAGAIVAVASGRVLLRRVAGTPDAAGEDPRGSSPAS